VPKNAQGMDTILVTVGGRKLENGEAHGKSDSKRRFRVPVRDGNLR
jgi:hypothetical protein